MLHFNLYLFLKSPTVGPYAGSSPWAEEQGGSEQNPVAKQWPGRFYFFSPGCWMKQPFCEQPLFTFFQTKVGISSDASSLVTDVYSQPDAWKIFLIVSEPMWACSALGATASWNSKPLGEEKIPHHCWAILCTEAKHPAQLSADFGPGAVRTSSKHLLTSLDSEPLMRGVRSFPQGLQTLRSQHLDFVHKIERFLKTCCWSA